MEPLKHECGVAMIRLRKPLSYYKEKYGTELYALNKLYLLMEKQHNRGQEAAGLGCVNLSATPGNEFLFRERAIGSGAIQEIFGKVHTAIASARDAGEAQLPFVGDVYMGHLRYSTTGKSGISYVHPFLRRNNWRSQNLMLCGNFNMTNVDEIFDHVVSEGQHPRIYSDTFLLLEQLGHSLDVDCERLTAEYAAQNPRIAGKELTKKVENNIDIKSILKSSSKYWDGGYVICGIVGSGNMFALRDPHGIRPAFYYYDDEIVVVASERPVIQTTMNLHFSQIHELTPGSAIIVSPDGEVEITDVLGEQENQRCSFERIYFSRGSDIDIYRERKALGFCLSESVLKAVDYDLDHTVVSFIPNTAEVAYIGLLQGLQKHLNDGIAAEIMHLDRTSPQYSDEVKRLLSKSVRTEKIAIKDIKLRTFIAEDNSRNDLATHVYDVTYGQIESHVDNLVVIDDSIVRGTTLKQSIIRILDRLKPMRIIIVSSSPQVRYPDYYGIDMSRMNEFCAFRAAIALLKERNMQSVIDDVYAKCKRQEHLPKEDVVNYVTEIYAPFTDEEVANKITEMLTPEGINAEVKLVYQSLEGMHEAIPTCPGDWYFSGNYPTSGGNKMINKAFINYYEGNTSAR